MVVSGSVRTVVAATETKTVQNATYTGPFSYDKKKEYTNGTAANQIDLLYQKTATLISTSEELDLAGVLTNGLGDTFTAVEITTVYIEVLTLTPGVLLTVGGAATNGFISWAGGADDKIKIGPEGRFLIDNPIDGYAVTAGTADKLKIESTGTVQYRLCLYGRSA